jgi:hypothetical protein
MLMLVGIPPVLAVRAVRAGGGLAPPFAARGSALHRQRGSRGRGGALPQLVLVGLQKCANVDRIHVNSLLVQRLPFAKNRSVRRMQS